MKKLLLLLSLFIFLTGCEKETDDNIKQYVAQIVGFDGSCSTCILSFPYDSVRVRNLLGKSLNNYYQAVNLDKSEFEINQLIKVKVRDAYDKELGACFTFMPSYPYKYIYIYEYELIKNLILNDTINLSYGNCVNIPETGNMICFESVIADSRCPEDVICVWAGEAVARFIVKTSQQKKVVFDLKAGTSDTIMNEYVLSFIDLLPHPNTRIQTIPEDYEAIIVLSHK